MDTENWKHPKHGELYTPVTPEVLDVIRALKTLHGTWAVVAFHTNTRSRILRRYLKGEHAAMSLMLMDRLLVALGVGNLDDFVWFTPDDLVVLGVWKETQYAYYHDGVRVTYRKSEGEERPARTRAEWREVKRQLEKEKKRKRREKEKREKRWMERYGWRPS